jgi:hypothetical protein
MWSMHGGGGVVKHYKEIVSLIEFNDSYLVLSQFIGEIKTLAGTPLADHHFTLHKTFPSHDYYARFKAHRWKWRLFSKRYLLLFRYNLQSTSTHHETKQQNSKTAKQQNSKTWK